MNHRCLPHDVLLLCARWTDPEHFPGDRAVTGWDWRSHYERRLEATMAQWIGKAILGWQFEVRRPMAFAPVAHLVGTAREDLDHIDSIARLCRELDAVPDPNYRPSPDPGGPGTGHVCLGVCLENGIALALKLLVQRSTDHMHAPDEFLAALHDLLRLVQAVRPFNAAEPLCDAWDLLFRDGHAAIFTPDDVRALRHQFVLALYPLAHTGVQHERIAQLVKRLAEDIPVLDRATAADVRATYDMIFGPGDAATPDDELPVHSAPALPVGFPAAWSHVFAAGARQ
ncbi:hypothetical protein [Massilia sp. METH4]|uniref:hypothetical protein n=1 Tax=Massilia sp. METH4 TaxID=3123041 RepID=UPI0030CD5CC1